MGLVGYYYSFSPFSRPPNAAKVAAKAHSPVQSKQTIVFNGSIASIGSTTQKQLHSTDVVGTLVRNSGVARPVFTWVAFLKSPPEKGSGEEYAGLKTVDTVLSPPAGIAQFYKSPTVCAVRRKKAESVHSLCLLLTCGFDKQTLWSLQAQVAAQERVRQKKDVVLGTSDRG